LIIDSTYVTDIQFKLWHFRVHTIWWKIDYWFKL